MEDWGWGFITMNPETGEQRVYSKESPKRFRIPARTPLPSPIPPPILSSTPRELSTLSLTQRHQTATTYKLNVYVDDIAVFFIEFSNQREYNNAKMRILGEYRNDAEKKVLFIEKGLIMKLKGEILNNIKDNISSQVTRSTRKKGADPKFEWILTGKSNPEIPGTVFARKIGTVYTIYLQCKNSHGELVPVPLIKTKNSIGDLRSDLEKNFFVLKVNKNEIKLEGNEIRINKKLDDALLETEYNVCDKGSFKERKYKKRFYTQEDGTISIFEILYNKLKRTYTTPYYEMDAGVFDVTFDDDDPEKLGDALELKADPKIISDLDHLSLYEFSDPKNELVLTPVGRILYNTANFPDEFFNRGDVPSFDPVLTPADLSFKNVSSVVDTNNNTSEVLPSFLRERKMVATPVYVQGCICFILLDNDGKGKATTYLSLNGHVDFILDEVKLVCEHSNIFNKPKSIELKEEIDELNKKGDNKTISKYLLTLINDDEPLKNPFEPIAQSLFSVIENKNMSVFHNVLLYKLNTFSEAHSIELFGFAGFYIDEQGSVYLCVPYSMQKDPFDLRPPELFQSLIKHNLCTQCDELETQSYITVPLNYTKLVDFNYFADNTILIDINKNSVVEEKDDIYIDTVLKSTQFILTTCTIFKEGILNALFCPTFMANEPTDLTAIEVNYDPYYTVENDDEITGELDVTGKLTAERSGTEYTEFKQTNLVDVFDVKGDIEDDINFIVVNITYGCRSVYKLAPIYRDEYDKKIMLDTSYVRKNILFFKTKTCFKEPTSSGVDCFKLSYISPRLESDESDCTVLMSLGFKNQPTSNFLSTKIIYPDTYCNPDVLLLKQKGEFVSRISTLCKAANSRAECIAALYALKAIMGHNRSFVYDQLKHVATETLQKLSLAQNEYPTSCDLIVKLSTIETMFIDSSGSSENYHRPAITIFSCMPVLIDAASKCTIAGDFVKYFDDTISFDRIERAYNLSKFATATTEFHKVYCAMCLFAAVENNTCYEEICLYMKPPLSDAYKEMVTYPTRHVFKTRFQLICGRRKIYLM